jgi:hypothetical protein
MVNQAYYSEGFLKRTIPSSHGLPLAREGSGIDSKLKGNYEGHEGGNVESRSQATIPARNENTATGQTIVTGAIG